ncbi:EVE domain-containing protein [Bacillus sp. S/N-304-OC-R1]|uniref:EVE domain-containing protein n=1 Tax=Bacillus sp. S/N-304-OC-R1 TaxID=2758034 RepID=UPI001C8E36EB|nr:EVE domain-containing protein [Bacillus sp. S/N-304-OC-R1]MBY0120919.1 EVE domain-containing protein [Bacillus sp. S/N-304-OC-R1]
MNTWIFQGNPTKFNINDYILENKTIWWSIRQTHLADVIQLGDEVFIWRSYGGERDSGGIVARTEVITLPQEYTNDDESAMYWYEDVSGDTYLAVELRVLEVDIEVGINRIELTEHPKLKDLMILRLKQNTNYLVDEKHKSYLKQLWYSRYSVNKKDIATRFPLVESLEQVKENMKQFEKDLIEVKELEDQLKSFQQWYYIHDKELLAPSKFIGYQDMKGHMYVDKDAIEGLHGGTTEVRLKKLGFVIIENELLKKYIQQKLKGKTRKDFSVNILKSERQQIESIFVHSSIDKSEKQLSVDFHKEMLIIYDKSKTIGYVPTKFRQMVANEGGLRTAKKLINSKNLSDGFAELARLGRLDLTVESLILQRKYKPLFTKEELLIARERLSQLGYHFEEERSENDVLLPPLDSNGRVREYNSYPDELKGKVIYEHLINNKTHRWMDINVLGRGENNNGRDSANILHYLGLRANYRGLFKGKLLKEVVEFLQNKGEDYADIVRLLIVYGKSEELYENVKSDIESQEIEEGNGIEGTKKSYLVNKYERVPKNRKKAIEIHGLNCYVCGFNFEEVYGERGKDFIEVHHISPLSTLEEAVEINPKTDLVPLCANCHRMIHRRKDEILTIEELREILKRNKRD